MPLIWGSCRDCAPTLHEVPAALLSSWRRSRRRSGSACTGRDLRIARTFRLGDRVRIEPQLDVFNVPNADTVIRLGDLIGPRLNRPSEILAPRLVRVRVVVTF
jgi:hypothetical protein